MTLLTVSTVSTCQCTVKTVRVITARFHMKQTHRNMSVLVHADVEDNTSIFFFRKELELNIYQLHYFATNFKHILCKIIFDI